jgi:hypothetical protein
VQHVSVHEDFADSTVVEQEFRVQNEISNIEMGMEECLLNTPRSVTQLEQEMTSMNLSSAFDATHDNLAAVGAMLDSAGTS